MNLSYMYFLSRKAEVGKQNGCFAAFVKSALAVCTVIWGAGGPFFVLFLNCEIKFQVNPVHCSTGYAV